jgi:hypothetical protein
MSKEKTATDWLFEKLWDTPKDKFTWYALLKEANKMFEEQIMDAYLSDRFPCSNEDGEQYYNETFGE